MLILIALALCWGVTMKSDKVRYVVTNVWQEGITSIFLASFWGEQVPSKSWQLPAIYRVSLKLYDKFQG